MGRPYPVAASSAVELVLVGPARPATVIATTTHATYLRVDSIDDTLLCLASAAAVRVPCAVILESRAMPPQLPVGSTGRLGGGLITLTGEAGPVSYRAMRWWRPPRPRGLGAVSPSRLAAAVRWLTGRVADPLDIDGGLAVVDLVDALASGKAPEEAVSRLLGRGPGLTPTGDDVLAGALVTLQALGSPAAAPLARAVRALAPGATTAVSVGLLRYAAEGSCIPQLADLLAALAPPAQSDLGTSGAVPALPSAAGALLAVGHCSGAGLLHGVLVAVAIAHARLAAGILSTRGGHDADTPARYPTALEAVA